MLILRFQKLDLVGKVDGWNMVFRVESQVSAKVQTKEPLSSERCHFRACASLTWGRCRAVAKDNVPFFMNCDGWDEVFTVEGRDSAEVKIKERQSSGKISCRAFASMIGRAIARWRDMFCFY